MTRSRLLRLGVGVVASPPSSSPRCLRPPRRSRPPCLHRHRLRLRPRPRPLPVRRSGRGQPGPLVEADHRLLLPGDPPGQGARTIKVLITADKKDVVVDARDGLRLTRLTGRKAFNLAKVRPKATRWRIMPRGSRSVVSYRVPSRGGWRSGRRSRVPRSSWPATSRSLSGCRGTGPRTTAAPCGRSRSTRSTCCRSTATCRVSSRVRSRPSGRRRRSAPRPWRPARTPRSSGRPRRRTTTSATPSPARTTAESRTSTRRPPPR